MGPHETRNPWYSMVAMEAYGFHRIPWNPWYSMDICIVWIPWDPLETMEPHGFLGLPRNSMESMKFYGFHGIPHHGIIWLRWNSFESMVSNEFYVIHPLETMELHGIP